MAKILRAPANRKTGNLWQSPQTGRWHFEVLIKRRDGTEFRRQGHYKIEQKARAMRDAAFIEFNDNEGKADGNTLQSWAEHCLTDIFPNEHQENSTAVYQYVLSKHLFPRIGQVNLIDATPQLLQVFFNQVLESKSESVAIKVRTALSACLTRAVMMGMITNNPAKFVKIKRASRTQIEKDDDNEHDIQDKRILSDTEQKALLKACKDSSIEPVVWLGLKLGLRMGECLGLSWANVDLTNRTIRIKQQLQRIAGNKGLQLRPPKTAAGIRTIDISDSLFEFLEQHRAKAGVSKSLWVCPNEKGNWLEPRNVVRRFARIAKIAEVGEKSDGTKVFLNGQEGKPDVTHHDLRSTLLSYLANHANGGQGVRPAILKKIAGHSKIDTTMRYYVRAQDSDVKDAMRHVA